MLTNNKKDVTVKVNDIKSIKSIQKKINENDHIYVSIVCYFVQRDNFFPFNLTVSIQF